MSRAAMMGVVLAACTPSAPTGAVSTAAAAPPPVVDAGPRPVDAAIVDAGTAAASAPDGGKAVLRTRDSQAKVQRAAGKGAAVSALPDIGVPNIERFWIVTKNRAGKPGTGHGVVVVDGALPWLDEAKAMDAIVAAGVTDPVVLARAAIGIVTGKGPLIVTPDDAPGGAARLGPVDSALIHPPQRSGDTLTFWYFAGRSGILQIRLDTKTWQWTYETLASRREAGQDPVALGRKWLDDTGRVRVQSGIDRLVAACADPRAGAVLVEAVTSHARPFTRALAARALAKCRTPDGVPALIAALGKDADVEVRKASVEALGMIGDASARSALEKAAQDDADVNVRAYAAGVLRKLAKP